MLKRLFIRCLLGQKDNMFDVIKIRGSLYKVSIQQYEPVEQLVSRMEKALQRQGLDN